VFQAAYDGAKVTTGDALLPLSLESPAATTANEAIHADGQAE